MTKKYNHPVWETQGGGLAENRGGAFYFVEAPHPGTGLEVGDRVPSEWDLVPANELAQELESMDDIDRLIYDLGGTEEVVPDRSRIILEH